MSEHLLVDAAGQQLSGVIDFGDVGLGDPAHDLLGFWTYGVAAVERVIAGYAFKHGDAGLLLRSHRAWARYRVDQLWQALRWDEPEQADAAADGLATLLRDVASR